MTIHAQPRPETAPWWQIMPPISAQDYDRLKASIGKYGLLPGQEPVVDEAGRILDGHTRARICAELGLDCPTRFVGRVMTDEEKWDYVWAMNVPRRHLNIEQKRELIAERLRRHPEESNRSIAEDVGSDHKTVAVQRTELEQTGEIPQYRAEGGRGIRTAPDATDFERCDQCERPVKAKNVVEVDGYRGHVECLRPSTNAGNQARDPERLIEQRAYVIWQYRVASEDERMRGDLPYPREGEWLEWESGPIPLTTPVPHDRGGLVATFTELGKWLVREATDRPIRAMDADA